MARDHGPIAQVVPSPPSGQLPKPQRKFASWQTWSSLERPAQGRVLAGVAPSLASTIGVTPLAVRVALVALSFVGGAGIVVYIAGWLLIAPPGGTRIAKVAVSDGRTVPLVLGAVSVLVAVLVIASILGHNALVGAVSPGLVAAAGLVAVWRHAGPEDRAGAERLAGLLSDASTGPSRRRQYALAAVRLAGGALLVGLGTSTLLRPHHLTSADLGAALAALAVVAGLGLVLAPWWLKLGRDLAGERRARTRAQERAEMAEHLHDSVLQTLALIQRSSEDPQQVVRLAREQERQLRRWLFEGAPPGAPGAEAPASVSEALFYLQQEIENAHGLKVEIVTVGNTPLDERLGAMVAAAREAVVNAAKWSGTDVVSVYAEVEPEMVSIFVRDRGVGFDPDKVAKDRKGISESIRARVGRNGGTATVRSQPGEGTEIALQMPLRAA